MTNCASVDRRIKFFVFAWMSTVTRALLLADIDYGGELKRALQRFARYAWHDMFHVYSVRIGNWKAQSQSAIWWVFDWYFLLQSIRGLNLVVLFLDSVAKICCYLTRGTGVEELVSLILQWIGKTSFEWLMLFYHSGAGKSYTAMTRKNPAWIV